MTEPDTKHLQNLLLIKALKANLGELQDRVGVDWEQLRIQLESLIDDLLQAGDEQISLYVTQLIGAGLNTQAGDLIRTLLQQARGRANQIVHETRSLSTRAPGSKQPQPPPVDAAEPTAERVREETEALRRALQDYAAASEKAEPEPSLEANPRYLNLFFNHSDSDEPLSEDMPLICATPYGLHVHIGPERKGIHQDDTPFPDEAVAEQWEEQTTLPITVMVDSRDFVLPKRLDTLQLPREGLSNEVVFPVTPRSVQGRGFIQVSLFYRGHLLQSKRVEALIVSAAGDPVPPTQRPAQRALTTFTTTETLDRQTLQRFPERVLTINVEKDERDGSLDLHFIDRTQGTEVACYDTQLNPAALKGAIDGLRRVLQAMVTGGAGNEALPASEGYGWILDGNPALLDLWLPRLAEAGRGLYRALLPPEQRNEPMEVPSGRLHASPQPDTVIQINPVLGKATLPWSLLYERPLKYVSGLTKVCPEHASCGLDCTDCPNVDDAYTVCPNAFWGYRYALEQLPCWITAKLSHPSPLVQHIDNGSPLTLNFNVYDGFRFWQDHIEKLKRTSQISLLQAESILELDEIWERKGAELELVYFYVHGGLDELSREPYLKLRDGRITSNFLEASKLSWTRNPLVFLNGCETGNYHPESYLSLIEDFRNAGASGVVGTECPVPELFAEAYAGAVLLLWFRGERLGQAMLKARRQFLDEKLNPLGLLYALFASSELALSTPVATKDVVEDMS